MERTDTGHFCMPIINWANPSSVSYQFVCQMPWRYLEIYFLHHYLLFYFYWQKKSKRLKFGYLKGRNIENNVNLFSLKLLVQFNNIYAYTSDFMTQYGRLEQFGSKFSPKKVWRSTNLTGQIFLTIQDFFLL